jgi:hypothetical protein
MTAPVPGPALVVRPEHVTAVAAELTGLAAELGEEAGRCRAAGPPLAGSLAGEEGWAAARVASVWGSVLEVVAARTGVLAGVLGGVAESYRAAEAARADRIPAAVTDDRPPAGPR